MLYWIVYTAVCAAVAHYANTRQRNPLGWFAFAFVTSPLVAAAVIWYMGEPEEPAIG